MQCRQVCELYIIHISMSIAIKNYFETFPKKTMYNLLYYLSTAPVDADVTNLAYLLSQPVLILGSGFFHV